MEDEIKNIKIIFAKPPLFSTDYKGMPYLRQGEIEPKKEIEGYNKITAKSNIYLRVEDTLYYSPTLSSFYKLFPIKVKDSLIKYILEGVVISDGEISHIKININTGTYDIHDIYRMYNSKEILKNLNKL